MDCLLSNQGNDRRRFWTLVANDMTYLQRGGAKVLVHYAKSVQEPNEVVDTIRNMGARADAVSADLSAPDGPFKLAEQVRNLVKDRLDILIANAGVAKGGAIGQTTIADFDQLFSVNVKAPFFVLQQLLPLLPEGSSVIFVSSLVAHEVVGVLSAYAATKGAINTMVKHFAAEFGGRGVRVNAAAPGVVATDMSSFVKTEEGPRVRARHAGFEETCGTCRDCRRDRVPSVI